MLFWYRFLRKSKCVCKCVYTYTLNHWQSLICCITMKWSVHVLYSSISKWTELNGYQLDWIILWRENTLCHSIIMFKECSTLLVRRRKSEKKIACTIRYRNGLRWCSIKKTTHPHSHTNRTHSSDFIWLPAKKKKRKKNISCNLN